jgi:hypothetical protein
MSKNIAFIVLAVLIVAGLLTALHLGMFQRDCVQQGGTFSIEGTSAHCRY